MGGQTLSGSARRTVFGFWQRENAHQKCVTVELKDKKSKRVGAARKFKPFALPGQELTLISGPARGNTTIDETGMNLMISGPSEPFGRSTPFLGPLGGPFSVFGSAKAPTEKV